VTFAHSNRYRVYYVSPEDILAVLLQGSPTTFRIVPAEGGEPLPPDARVVSVHDDFPRRMLAFIVESESFDIVPCGALPEGFPNPMQTVKPVVVPAALLKRAIALIESVKDDQPSTVAASMDSVLLDYRELILQGQAESLIESTLRKYIRHVLNNEGTDFIPSDNGEFSFSPFSDDELEILHSMRDGDFQPRPESVAESTLRKYVQETHNHYQLRDGSPLPDGYYTDDEQCLLRRMRPQ